MGAFAKSPTILRYTPKRSRPCQHAHFLDGCPCSHPNSLLCLLSCEWPERPKRPAETGSSDRSAWSAPVAPKFLSSVAKGLVVSEQARGRAICQTHCPLLRMDRLRLCVKRKGHIVIPTSGEIPDESMNHFLNFAFLIFNFSYRFSSHPKAVIAICLHINIAIVCHK